MSIGFDGSWSSPIQIVHLIRCSKTQAWLLGMSQHFPVASILDTYDHASDLQWLLDLEEEAKSHPDQIYVPAPIEE